MTNEARQKAADMLAAWKGENYVFGRGCAGRIGELAARHGKRAVVVASGVGKDWARALLDGVRSSLESAGVEVLGDFVTSPAPNAPFEDVMRIAAAVCERSPEVVASVGGGSCIDATKAAVAYAVLKGKHADLIDYFGVGQVSAMLSADAAAMLPVVAVQLASGSAAHLTKYSNATDVHKSQKMLIVDEAIIPPAALFDYEATTSMSPDFTMDGALDGIAHCLEVLYGAGGDALSRTTPVSLLGTELIVGALKAAVADPADLDAREALGLGTDLGGYAIMIAGTNGPHLNSFSLVDLLSHGRACALMNPYYTVFFAPAIEDRLRGVGAIYARAGYVTTSLEKLGGRDLGLAVAEGMIALSKDIGFPVTLSDVPGFSDEHVARCLTAAKNPKLEMKLKNMPVPLSAETVDEYMGGILAAAKSGDLSLIKNM